MEVLNMTREELTIQPATEEEMAALLDVFGVCKPGKDPRRYVELLDAMEPVTKRLGERSIAEGAGWTRVSVVTDYLRPYVDMIQNRTGHELREALELAEVLGRIKHTRIIDSAYFSGTELAVSAYVIAYGQFPEHDDIAREEKARNWLLEGLHDDLGHREPVREHILMSNGLYRRNPDYPHKRNPARPAVTNPDVYRALWELWKANHATPAQLEVLEGTEALGSHARAGISDYRGLYTADKGGPIDWDAKGTMARFIEWSEFAELK